MRSLLASVLIRSCFGLAFAQQPAPPKSVAPLSPRRGKPAPRQSWSRPRRTSSWPATRRGRHPPKARCRTFFAKALADEQGGRLVIVTMDLIGVPQSLRRAVTERTEKDYKLPPAGRNSGSESLLRAFDSRIDQTRVHRQRSRAWVHVIDSRTLVVDFLKWQWDAQAASEQSIVRAAKGPDSSERALAEEVQVEIRGRFAARHSLHVSWAGESSPRVENRTTVGSSHSRPSSFGSLCRRHAGFAPLRPLTTGFQRGATMCRLPVDD